MSDVKKQGHFSVFMQPSARPVRRLDSCAILTRAAIDVPLPDVLDMDTLDRPRTGFIQTMKLLAAGAGLGMTIGQTVAAWTGRLAGRSRAIMPAHAPSLFGEGRFSEAWAAGFG